MWGCYRIKGSAAWTDLCRCDGYVGCVARADCGARPLGAWRHAAEEGEVLLTVPSGVGPEVADGCHPEGG